MSKEIISSTCEFALDFAPTKFCGKPAVSGYPAAGGGFMALCEEHEVRHAKYVQPIADIKKGIPHPWKSEPMFVRLPPRNQKGESE